MFTQDLLIFTWNNTCCRAIKGRLGKQQVCVVDSWVRAYEQDQLGAILAEIHAESKVSSQALILLDGGCDSFALQEVSLPKLKEDFIHRSLLLQIDKTFPFEAKDLSVGFRKIEDDRYRVIATTKEKWQKLNELINYFPNGVDAIIPSMAIADMFYRDQNLYLDEECYIDEKGTLSSFPLGQVEENPLPPNVDSSHLRDEEKQDFFAALVLAAFSCSNQFGKTYHQISPLAEKSRPKRFKFAKKLFIAQTAIFLILAIALGTQRLKRHLSQATELKQQNQDIRAQIKASQFDKSQSETLEQTLSQISKFHENRKVSLASALLELTEKLPQSYSIQNFSYNSRNRQLTCSMRMNDKNINELIEFFHSSKNFENNAIFNDSGKRLILTLKGKETTNES